MIVGKRRKNTEQRGLPWFVIWFLCAETGAPAVGSLRDKSVNGEKVTKVVSRTHACFPSKSKFIENKIGSAWGTPSFFFFLSDRLTSEARACSPDVFHLSPFSFHFRYPEYTRLFFHHPFEHNSKSKARVREHMATRGSRSLLVLSLESVVVSRWWSGGCTVGCASHTYSSGFWTNIISFQTEHARGGDCEMEKGKVNV